MSKQKYPQSASATSTSTSTGMGHKRKTNGYSSSVLKAVRNAKRAEAEERQSRYDALSLKDRIKLAESRDGESKREITRLKAKLEKEKEKAPQVKPQALTETQKSVKAVKRAQDAAAMAA